MKKLSKKHGKSISRSKAEQVKKLEADIKKALAAPLKESKVRVNTWIDADIYLALNEEAESENIGYQTLLNRYLRASVLKEISKSDLKRILLALSDDLIPPKKKVS